MSIPDPPTYAPPFVRRPLPNDPNNAVINPVWLDWFIRAGRQANAVITNHEELAGLLGGGPNDHYHLTGAQRTLLVSGPTTAPAAITLGASPHTYQNTSGSVQLILVSGGTGVSLEYTRDNATFFAFASGSFPLGRGDRVRITYTAAPAVTAIAI